MPQESTAPSSVLPHHHPSNDAKIPKIGSSNPSEANLQGHGRVQVLHMYTDSTCTGPGAGYLVRTSGQK